MSEDDLQHPISPTGFHGQAPHSPAGSVHSVSEGPDGGAGGSGTAGDVPSIPAQKRRRVTRACDECRRKKIKCDGKQPCTHCSAYSYECTYDKPSNRRRNPAPQYIEALESRLHRAEALLRTFIPDVDLSDPNLDPTIQQEFRNRELARAQAKLRADQVVSPDNEDAQLLSMIESIGQLDLDDQGGWDFHGVSSGAVFLRRMKEHFQGLMGPPGTQLPFLPPKSRLQGLRYQDSSNVSTGSSPWEPASPHMPELPPREYARKLCYYSLNCATCLTRIVHIPSFYDMFDRIYAKPYEALTHEERRHLGLLYAVMAVGCMYDNFDDSGPQAAYQQTVEQGSKYYNAARYVLQDIVECRDLTSLQALLFMILFLQATSNLSACYAFVGIALRSAVRMGLHRNLQHEQITVVEQQVRRRVFYVVRQMDIYVSAMLGFPLLLNPDDMDQPYPTEVDDEYITNDGIIQPPPGTISFFEAFNAHTRLMDILARIIKHVYPLKGLGQSATRGDKPGTTYHISYASIKKIEAELQQWYVDLPEQWRPSSEGSMEVIRVRHLLRFSYAHVQLVLYRPFLHYVSPRLSAGKYVHELSYACAAAVISVSRNIVHIGIEIRRQGVLAGPYWFMLYAEYLSILSLVFYAVENPEKPGSGDVLSDAKAGRDMMEDLKSKSHAAERVAGALDVLFDQLPQRLLQARAQPIPTKKRSAPSSKPGSVPSHGHPGAVRSTLSQRGSEEVVRPASSSLPNGSKGQAPVRGSFENTYQETVFAPHAQEMRPTDVGSQTPGSTSSGLSSQPGAHGFPPTHPMYTNSPINRLDSLMFPSEDPFAYPNQPMMELGYSRAAPTAVSPGSGPAHARVSAPLDASQFSMAGPFDGMDPQTILGTATPFLVQQQQPPQQPHQVPPGLDPSDMYQNPTLAGMSEDALRLELAQRAAQVQRPTDYRELERMLAESGYQGNWGNIFGRGGYQDM
ncbi:hypothetical protein ACRALDRAFT_1044581 [Sodiomyces alcalophilus JCM 7366]|uniref:uncharacterized protein n=1 Tax=Sodiomyces alcalophilus JCM 7366 TaxID=591952 RepID=UPI0039B5AA99